MEPAVSQYNHSVKVPTQYRAAARLLKKTFEEGASLKGLIFEEKHAKTNRLYALIQKISDNKHVLDRLVADTGLRDKEPRLEKYLCAVLMTELLFGAGHLNGESKPVQCIRRYEPEFRALLAGGDAASNGGGATLDKEDGGGGGEPTRTPFKKEFEKPRYVRVNTNQISRADALELFVKDGWIERPFAADTQTYDEFLAIVGSLGEADFVSDMHVKNLFVFPASSKRFWARNALVRESKLVLQDKASCLPTVLLDPPRGATILDMCAAPGMKTSHLAAHIKNKGTIYAVEQHVRRYGTLCEIMASTRSSVSVQTINQDALALEDEGVPGVEYILVDPSCSGSGMTGRLFSTPNEKETDRLVLLCGLQMRMLQHAMRAFHSAKKIVYSTCSVHVEENEQVVSRCLEACPDWELVKPEAFAERWKHFGSAKWKHVGKKCFYAKPEVDLTDGFFVAVFERRPDAPGSVERVHDPDRDFLEQIHRNFSRKESAPVEVEEEEEYDDEYNDGYDYSYDEAKSVKQIKQEPIERTQPVKQEPIVEQAAVAVVPPVKEKKSKKSKTKTTVDDAAVAEESVVEPLKEKKKKKHRETIVEEPAEVAAEAAADEPLTKKRKKRSQLDTEVAQIEAVVKSPVAVDAAATPEKKKKKRNKDKDTAAAEAENQLQTPPAPVVDDDAELPAKKKKKKSRKEDVEAETVVEPPAAGDELPAKKKKSKKDKSA